MRPVNLIPAEQRSGARKPMRGGPLAYIVVGAMIAALLAVTVLVVTNNQISDRKAEIAQLQSERTVVEARAAELSAYTQFHSVEEQRAATVASLADSRFDWHRVMRELALILPGDVWLDSLTGSVSPESASEGSTGLALRASIPGPALEMTGCAKSQDAMAGLIGALKEIDGVTRVGIESSALGGGEGGVSSDASGSSSSCQTRDFIAQFQLVVAFDAAPAPSAAAAPEVAPAPEEAEATTTTTPPEG